ncbi:MAG TPA: hypothetical protein VJ302_35725 [Blastocatellia bacterium]|nr:hypothetical protein [Blastocatellia bacterium]
MRWLGLSDAEHGDFSGLGVVQIRLKESRPDQVAARFQGGSFNTFRTFLAYSPQLKTGNSFIADEGSRSDGPFLNPLRYKRDKVTGNYTLALKNRQSLGFKFNFGRNDFFSSGQIPLDDVFAGRMDRFGFNDPDDGGRSGSVRPASTIGKSGPRATTSRSTAFSGARSSISTRTSPSS